MDYHILKKYRYTNRNQFESIYSSRYENELVLHYDSMLFTPNYRNFKFNIKNL